MATINIKQLAQKIGVPVPEIQDAINRLGLNFHNGEIDNNDANILRQLAKHAEEQAMNFPEAVAAYLKELHNRQAQQQGTPFRDRFNSQFFGATEAPKGSVVDWMHEDQVQLGDQLTTQRMAALKAYSDARLMTGLTQGTAAVGMRDDQQEVLAKGQQDLGNLIEGMINWTQPQLSTSPSTNAKRLNASSQNTSNPTSTN